MRIDGTKKILLSAADGPEGIEIYTSEDEAICDWADHVPGLYIVVSFHGGMFKTGPFNLKSIQTQIAAQLKAVPSA